MAKEKAKVKANENEWRSLIYQGCQPPTREEVRLLEKSFKRQEGRERELDRTEKEIMKLTIKMIGKAKDEIGKARDKLAALKA